MKIEIGTKVHVIDPQSPWYKHQGVVRQVAHDQAGAYFLVEMTPHHRYMLSAQVVPVLTGCIECDTLRAGSSGAGRYCATHEAHLDRQDKLEGRDPHAWCDDEPCSECLRKSDLDAYDRAEEGGAR